MTIRTRLTLRFTGLVSAILAVAFTSIYAFSAYFISSDFYRRLNRKATTYAEMFIRQGLDGQLLQRLSRLRKDQLPNQKITVYDQRNIPIFTTNDAIILGLPVRVLEPIRKTENRNFRWRQYYVTGISYPTGAGKYVVVASAENRYGDDFLQTMRWALVGLFGVITGLVALSGWLYAGDVLEPMQRLEKQLSHIFPRNRQARLPVSGENDEISRLSATINRLLDRVEESFQLQRLFVANVSHELKNPLTQISSQLEVSLLNRREPEAYARTIRSVLDDVVEMSALTRELLQLSQVNQDDAEQLLTDSVRIDEIVWDLRDEVSSFHPRYEVAVKLENLPEDSELLTVTGNAALIRTAFKNLVENACKFSPEGKAVVTVRSGGESIRVSVQNEGSPIPSEDLPYIFEPFYRGRQTADVRGYGVGLSLVERIIRLHRGKISVVSMLGQPTVFDVELFRQPRF